MHNTRKWYAAGFLTAILTGLLCASSIGPGVFTSTLNGLVPFSGGGTTNFLRADGTWHAPAGSGATVIFSGTKSLATSSITHNTCASTQTVAATGVLSTDRITYTTNASISAVTGYTPAGTLTINAYPTADTINIDVCNKDQTNDVTPGAVVLNLGVIR
jgi:hypothetical protein